jgi:hypothetical protein
MIFGACSMYEVQSNILDKALSSSINKDETSIDLDSFKKDLIAKIEISQ